MRPLLVPADPTRPTGGSAAAQESLSALLRTAANDRVSGPGSLTPEAMAAAPEVQGSLPARGDQPASPIDSPGATPSMPDPVGGSQAAAARSGGIKGKGTPQTFLVFLNEAMGGGGVGQRARALMRSLGAAGMPSLVFEQLNGFALRITPRQAKRLRALGGVQSVEADAKVFLAPPIPAQATAPTRLQPQAATTTALSSYSNGNASSGETLPWGVRAVWQGADISARGNVAGDTYAFVIDTGVLSTTGDLNLASTGSWHRSWITGEGAFSDGNGHGTHVAGTIAALANGRGVVGVAPGAQVVALKVFDSSGEGGSTSSIIDAINHAVAVINNNGLVKSKVVINLSLGGGFSSSLDTAMKNAANQGVRLTVAAGNDGRDADNYSPAAAGDHANVFTVSAVDSTYAMPSWSNWDRLDRFDRVDDVDVAAPGVSVLSYDKNGQLDSWSGTSMAAPHVAGLLLMGSVQAGDLVKPYYSNTADPFALGILPSSPEPEPEPQPEPEPGPVEEPSGTETGLILWGSTGDDTISGGDGPDRLSGALASGTSAADMGAGQIDRLTGGAGADLFVLGDERGVFYDDRNAGNLGTSDDARITDFKSGEDKLQLASGSYLFTVSAGNLSLYWDRNGNGKLDSRGGNQDELIALLDGATTLASSDIVWA